MSHLQKAVIAHKEGRLSAAVESYQAALMQEPSSSEILHLLGTAHLQQGHLQDALTLLCKSTALAPQHVKSWSNLGIVYIQLNRLQEAISAFDKAIAIHPTAAALSNRGLAQQRLQHHQNAKQSFEAALSLEPENPNYILNLAVFLRKQGAVKDALSIINKTSQHTVEILNEKGLILIELNHIETAVDTFKQAIDLNSEWGPAWCNLGMALRHLGDIDDSLVALENAFRHNPSDPLNFVQFALSTYAKHDIAVAIEILKQGLQYSPNHPTILLHLSVFLEQRGQYEESISVIQTAIEQDQDNAQSWLQLGHLMIQTNQVEEARNAYDKARGLEPDNPEVNHFYHLISGQKITKADPNYIERVFDNYAGSFDQELVESLQYKTPKALRGLYDAHVGQSVDRIIDLGCGTGLSGESFVDISKTRIGIDLSRRMLSKAREKNIYAHLINADIVSALRQMEPAELIIASDVLNYFGDLEELMQRVEDKLTQHGYWLFSTESPDQYGEGLQPNGRFCHHRNTVLNAAQQAGLQLISSQVDTLRKERGSWVKGDLFLFKKGNH